MALGTEEGFVCLFSVTDEGLDFDKVLDKQEGRILCLDWHCDGKVLVTGALSLLLVPFTAERATWAMVRLRWFGGGSLSSNPTICPFSKVVG